MHKVIRFIVYADNKEGAMKTADLLLNRLCEKGSYDYGTFFNESSPVSGKTRWGQKPCCSLASGEPGKKLIDEAMKWQKDEFLEKIKAMRKVLEEYENDELYEEELQDKRKKIIETLENNKDRSFIEYLSSFRFVCNCIGGGYHGDIYLYDHEAQPIITKNDLKNALNKWGQKDKRKIYVIPCDTHF